MSIRPGRDINQDPYQVHIELLGTHLWLQDDREACEGSGGASPASTAGHGSGFEVSRPKKVSLCCVPVSTAGTQA